MMSVDKSIFCEFDESQTLIHELNSRGLEHMQRIEGKLIALSLDNKYLLLNDTKGYFFIEMRTWKRIASYDGPYDKDKDALVLNPENGGSCYCVKNCFTNKT